jgi:exonuclease 3'-5' domain-containing protein 1
MSLLIDSQESVVSLLEKFRDSPVQPPFLFVDLEGVNLSRQGSVAIMQMLMPPDPCVYLIDIHNLQEEAFKAETREGLSLRALLQSEKFVKIFFDVRNDSDALYSHFDVNLSCVVDLQVLEYVTRPSHGGLVKCVSQLPEIGMTELAKWKTVRDQGQKLIAPARGGRYQVLQERPLSADVIKYCVEDVLMLPKLLLSYSRRLHLSLAMKAHEETLRRIRLSQEPGFNGTGPHMARAPVHIWQRYADHLLMSLV